MRLRALLCRALWSLWYVGLLLRSFPPSATAQDKSLITQYVECVRDDKGRDVASRSMQTPVFNSKQGVIAYGVVLASHSSEGTCKSTSTVYLAEPGGTFRVALQQKPELLPDGSVYDGNGIETIRWSPSGTRLLIEVSQWTWGTDSTWNTKYLLLTPGGGAARELPIMAAIRRYFVPPCAWLVGLVSSNGWANETQINIEVNPYKDEYEEGVADPTPSCVAQPTLFSFDVVSGDFAPQIIEVNVPLSVEPVTSVVPDYIPENPKR